MESNGNTTLTLVKREPPEPLGWDTPEKLRLIREMCGGRNLSNDDFEIFLFEVQYLHHLLELTDKEDWLKFTLADWARVNDHLYQLAYPAEDGVLLEEDEGLANLAGLEEHHGDDLERTAAAS